ncbi:MAG TPA: diguanylate cyclase, partial [Acidimicrobiales bacterium]
MRREAALREASQIGVCREDRAQLETLARCASASRDFHAVITVRLEARESDTARFEVLHTDEGLVIRLLTDMAGPGDPTPQPDSPPPITTPAGAGPMPDIPELLALVADESPDLMATFAPISWQVQWANPAIREALQVPSWASPPLVELLDERSQGHFVVKVLPDLLRQGWWHGVLHLVGPDVEAVTTSATLVAHRRANGEIAALVLSAQRTRPPVTRVPARHDQFGALVEHVSDLIAVVEPSGAIRYTSPAAATMLGYSSAELAGRSLVDMVHPDDRPEDLASLVHLDEDGTARPVSLRLESHDGTWRFIEAVVSDLTANASIGGFVLNAQDVTARMHAQESLSALAFLDADTGLPNRLRLIDRVTTQLDDGAPGGLAVAVIDLDGFRLVHETRGAGAADGLVKQVGARLAEAAGAGSVVARLRSDEFAVSLADVAEAGVAMRAADALRVALSHPFEDQNGSVHLTASVGVSVATSSSTAEELLTRADRAAIVAKQGGGNRTEMWDEDTAERESHRHEVDTRLRTIVEEETLSVHYQPIISLADGSITGAEALL